MPKNKRYPGESVTDFRKRQQREDANPKKKTPVKVARKMKK